MPLFNVHSTYLHGPADIEWARDRWPMIPAETKVVVLTGNEDAPDVLECYCQAEPLVSDKPIKVIYPQ